MGSCGGGQSEDSRKNQAVEEEIRNSRQTKKVHKLLLLGPGNSGKSTFFKQLTQIHGEKYTTRDKRHSIPIVHDSILEQMKNIIALTQDEFHVTLEEKAQESAQFIADLPRDSPLNDEVAQHITVLWKDENIRKTFENRTHVEIVDSCPHFFDNIDRIAKSDYMPTEEDILLSRTPTTGIREATFTVKDNMFEVYDVGGQRSERQKWIHCFDGVHAVLFVVSLSSYDQMLYEDNEVNAMTEAVILWNDVCNSEYFSNKKISMIIFFNKSDLFLIKVAKKSIKTLFTDYNGSEFDFQESFNFIRNLFLDKLRDKTKQIYTHITNATDRSNVERVFNDVQHSVVFGALAKNGIL